jgi:ABC-type Fe3+/spermidine/putrescine transport system ATPase subunit
MGSPTDIYERPATPFVADFIGGSNFFRGVLHHSGSTWQVMTNEGFALPVAQVNEGLADGARVVVTVRPENIELSSGTSSRNATAIPVKVEQIVYRGARTYLYLRRSNGEPLVASCRNEDSAPFRGAAESDSAVLARWDASKNHVMPEQAEA